MLLVVLINTTFALCADRFYAYLLYKHHANRQNCPYVWLLKAEAGHNVASNFEAVNDIKSSWKDVKTHIQCLKDSGLQLPSCSTHENTIAGLWLSCQFKFQQCLPINGSYTMHVH